MASYIGLVHKDADSDHGISFPDFPGCVSAGSTLDETRANAEEALALHIKGMIEDGETIPEATSLADVMADPANRYGSIIMVKALSFYKRKARS